MNSLTIVIPTYNEADNLPLLTSELWSLGIPNLNIIVVDDGSPDGTGEIAEQIALAHPGLLKVIHREGKLGIGSAYITGFQMALQGGSKAIGQMDADFSHAPSYIPKLLENLDQYDAVFGSRYVEGGRLDENWGIGRVLLSWFGNYYARTILNLDILDVTGGFRIWRRETLAGMPLNKIRSNGYVFQVEMAYVSSKLGFRACEIPIYFEDRRIGQSKMSFRITVEAVFRVWQVLWMHRSLHP
jgi:dolichol-phosphate mannosyltransferase